MVEEVAVVVEVLLLELCLADELVGEPPLEVHHELEHLVVRLSREHDLARVHFVESHRHGPQIDAEVVRKTEH